MSFFTKLPSYFFNLWFRFFPPPLVSYWKKNDSARARVRHQPDGSYGLEIEGEKYVMPGFPRGHTLFGSLSKIKHKIRMAFNQAHEEIEPILKEAKYDVVPYEKLLPATKELWRSFEDLENAEVSEDMKERMKLWKTILCWWLQEDDAFRYRLQWLLERLNMRKMRLTKEDKYFFRGKYFKVDHKRKFLGIDWDIFSY